MTTLFCWMIGGLFAISIYLLLSQQLMRWLFGIVILSSSTNFVLLIVGRLSQVPPFVSPEKTSSLASVANPLPQALILTAIVIGFGLLSFALVLVRKVWRQFKTLDSDKLRLAEPVPHREKIAS
ncbi:NADH-quinone oxidoreductase subunit K [Coxiella burnetii]|uniref:Sodium/proton antiporter protein n=1 Tax=Coxiella burnetii (strain RSA 493 / Nine Mile phase I) TaxID=227377 RepID=Q83BC5_COXBU|nr:NADH-quinone oxidoreductase subunit K [Coxiella burnetii]NP_820569.1 hypothetical protein CBU_1586 [Coxiella burnetii RSA 493]AAO91083.1 hypothetical protein CBU_1586 [Coxiella burnetii RSA 493]ABX77858.1 Na(+)/H(+) antiporter subunit C [Coxiella burnetii RSA 331]ACJ17853.1 potassium efflux system protein [Coxiella burnetii CbuG_Q212]ACJ20942.1 potassium efflux system protein [Coxiella burnetii CbuK_Q154]AIT64019.1 Na(+)/H(+) antiporter subunit C [Coxiella burnetii str. Namibia]